MNDPLETTLAREWVCVGCESFVANTEAVPRKVRGRDRGKPCCPKCACLLHPAKGKCFRCGGETTTQFPAPGYIRGHCPFCEKKRDEENRAAHPERYLPPVKYFSETEVNQLLAQARAEGGREEKERVVVFLRNRGRAIFGNGNADRIEAGEHNPEPTQ